MTKPFEGMAVYRALRGLKSKWRCETAAKYVGSFSRQSRIWFVEKIIQRLLEGTLALDVHFYVRLNVNAFTERVLPARWLKKEFMDAEMDARNFAGDANGQRERGIQRIWTCKRPCMRALNIDKLARTVCTIVGGLSGFVHLCNCCWSWSGSWSCSWSWSPISSKCQTSIWFIFVSSCGYRKFKPNNWSLG